ncbi:hypothetical protein [Paenarthrobacter sp. A20]|uniref:hypothetical protein n=1 Tax=Paenarthrobacter sp. A20 TaxID=2817891 RepID=UPI0020A01E71|nr:hypothetical protein [Paenarthrobacter sp. A20]MCP1414370.1 hypothetical protein [Paenarthrobacter sp. A20]
MNSITTSSGTTVSVHQSGPDALLFLDHPEAPDDMRHLEAGRVTQEGFQPAPFAAFGLGPETLRAIADLIENTK